MSPDSCDDKVHTDVRSASRGGGNIPIKRRARVAALPREHHQPVGGHGMVRVSPRHRDVAQDVRDVTAGDAYARDLHRVADHLAQRVGRENGVPVQDLGHGASITLLTSRHVQVHSANRSVGKRCSPEGEHQHRHESPDQEDNDGNGLSADAHAESRSPPRYDVNDHARRYRPS